MQILRFYNSKQGTLVIRKLDSETHEPLAGVEFELTYADGGYVDDANGTFPARASTRPTRTARSASVA